MKKKQILYPCNGVEYQGPYTIYDLEVLRQNARLIKKLIPRAQLYYAMKCNPLIEVLSTLRSEGVGFEVASQSEVETLVDMKNVTPSKILCFHPIKSSAFLKYLSKKKIHIMAVDSIDELEKINEFAPQAKLVVRVNVPNTSSQWVLSGKYGIDLVEAKKLVDYAKKLGLTIVGTTIHVGSQCTEPNVWSEALKICRLLWEHIEQVGYKPDVLSLGGGLPVKYSRTIKPLKSHAKIINSSLEKYFPDRKIRITIEPGRSIVANAAYTITEIFGKAKRGNENWIYIDVGTYNGLAESIETDDRNFYKVSTFKKSKKSTLYNIGGPSCVTLDTPLRKICLPPLNIGDKLCIHSTGAYSITCSAPFNGFPVPKCIFIDSKN